MLLKTRVLIITAASLASLVIMGAFGLYTMRQSMYEERHAQLNQLLDFADSQIRYFYSLEASGKLSRQEAQERAKEALGSQKQGNNYYFIRSLTDDTFIYHPIASRINKADDGGIQTGGRTTAQINRDELAKSTNNKAFVLINTAKPGDQTKALYPKLNGLLKFEPWGWMPGTGFFVDDIESEFKKKAAIFLLVAGVLVTALAVLVFRMRADILHQLGGEPQDAAESMRRIARGDLNINISLQEGDSTSLMASLKQMQLKLNNITSTIQENSTALSTQVDQFERAAKTYTEEKSEEAFSELLRSVNKLGRISDILGKSISRFRL
mgnify:CR=1 FL=1